MAEKQLDSTVDKDRVHRAMSSQGNEFTETKVVASLFLLAHIDLCSASVIYER